MEEQTCVFGKSVADVYSMTLGIRVFNVYFSVVSFWLSSHIWLFRLVSSQLIDAALPAARIGSRSEPFSRGMSFCLYASRSGANKKSPVSVDWHYMTLRNHCQKAS
ncbi:hypothetical protein EYF80_001799 [Liparis tanakae]|uniref:Uncharacterized protein n=1 Tax=Liparis tanakae TaxID=230148 RepID=A0A4Z2JBZ1_9TELE|nr:hypothetical protein EYF80_001799 [Liparis tanakae]